MFSTNKIYSGQFFRKCLSFAVREKNLKASSALKKNNLTPTVKIAFVPLHEKQENGSKWKEIGKKNPWTVGVLQLKGFFRGVEGLVNEAVLNSTGQKLHHPVLSFFVVVVVIY